jgi:hypothetical protein
MNIEHIDWCDDNSKLAQFLENELKIPPVSIEMAQRLCRQQLGDLPIILWKHGILSSKQLEQTWDWLETS